jgi:Domain of unknown function (DUF1992)
VPFEKLAERKIREAMDAGEFDDLPNAGSPIDLEAYFSLPSHLRMAFSILKSANCLPAEVEMLNEVSRLEAAAANAAGAEERARLSAELQGARLRLALALERLSADTCRRKPCP